MTMRASSQNVCGPVVEIEIENFIDTLNNLKLITSLKSKRLQPLLSEITLFRHSKIRTQGSTFLPERGGSTVVTVDHNTAKIVWCPRDPRVYMEGNPILQRGCSNIIQTDTAIICGHCPKREPLCRLCSLNGRDALRPDLRQRSQQQANKKLWVRPRVKNFVYVFFLRHEVDCLYNRIYLTIFTKHYGFRCRTKMVHHFTQGST